MAQENSLIGKYLEISGELADILELKQKKTYLSVGR
ncbi:Uncharacterised protein [Streptococcus pneumoniae]|nr:Uncharacterised protein [Streptococcus pneumoniae]